MANSSVINALPRTNNAQCRNQWWPRGWWKVSCLSHLNYSSSYNLIQFNMFSSEISLSGHNSWEYQGQQLYFCPWWFESHEQHPSYFTKQFPSLTGNWKGIPKILGFLWPTGSFLKTVGSIFNCFLMWLMRIVRTTHNHIRTGNPIPLNLACASTKDLIQHWWCPQNLQCPLAILLHLCWIVTSPHKSHPIIRHPYSSMILVRLILHCC